MTATQYLLDQIKELCSCLVARNNEYLFDQVTRILEERYGDRFYRVNRIPDNPGYSNYILMRSSTDVEISINNNKTIQTLLSMGLERG